MVDSKYTAISTDASYGQVIAVHCYNRKLLLIPMSLRRFE